MSPVVGRFAPSPTGRLHLGSLTTALASFCQAKHERGRWLVRLEDADQERCRLHYADAILWDLERLGLHWDGLSRQSERLSFYDDAIEQLGAELYACCCSRKTLASYPIYPRFCLGKQHQGQKIRLCLPDYWLGFYDDIQGTQWQNPQHTLGDVVICRHTSQPNKAKIISYILACAVDDGEQAVTQLVRGLDILPMTAAQLWLQKRLGLPTPARFFHLPLLYNAKGQKLSKQTLARPIDTTVPEPLLCHALALLGQRVDDLGGLPKEELLAVAVARWDSQALKGKQAVEGVFV